MHPAEIQSEIKKLGYSQKELAEKWGKTPGALSRAVNGNMISYPLMRRISQLINKPVHVVYPQYFTPDRESLSRAA